MKTAALSLKFLLQIELVEESKVSLYLEGETALMKLKKMLRPYSNLSCFRLIKQSKQNSGVVLHLILYMLISAKIAAVQLWHSIMPLCRGIMFLPVHIFC